MSFFGKVMGKFMTYFGLIVSFAGISWESLPLCAFGLITVGIGCFWHERNEK